MLPQLLFAIATAGLSSAHFVLNWPPTAGFNDDLEATSPCGGVAVTVNSSSPQVQVDRFAVLIQSTHPTGEWLFRATTDTQAPYNWTTIVPVLNTTGLGNFCLPSMRAPTGFAGKPGIIQVIDNSVDGELYQCAPVNFVSGSNSTLGSACANSSSEFTAVFTNLQSFNGTTGTSTMSMPSGTASHSASAASATSSGAAAMVTGMASLVGGLGLLAAGLVL